MHMYSTTWHICKCMHTHNNHTYVHTFTDTTPHTVCIYATSKNASYLKQQKVNILDIFPKFSR